MRISGLKWEIPDRSTILNGKSQLIIECWLLILKIYFVALFQREIIKATP